MRSQLLPEEEPAIVRIGRNTVHKRPRRRNTFRGGPKRILVHPELDDLQAKITLDLFGRIFRAVCRYLPYMRRHAVRKTHFLNSWWKWATSSSDKKRHSPGFSFSSSRKPIRTRRSFSTGWPTD